MDKRYILEAEIEQSLGKTAWTHKIQEKQADIYNCWSKTTEITRIGLSAITTSGILAVVLGADDFWLKVTTAIISLLSTAINLYLKKYDFSSLEKEHKSSAVEWLCLREDYIALITEIRMDIVDDDILIERRNQLRDKYKELTKKAPSTTDRAYSKASKSLKINMDNIISKEEIDAFLPLEARRGDK